MLVPGPAKKVTIYFNEDTVSDDTFLSEAILSLLVKQGVAGATIIRPAAGFGSHHRLHTSTSGIDADLHMPIRVEFIDSEDSVAAVLPRLEELLVDGLIETQDTMVLKYAVSKKLRSSTGEAS